MGRVGQIHAVQANLRYPESVTAAVRDADVVVNLVGLLFERGRQRFDAVMTGGRRNRGARRQAVSARRSFMSPPSAPTKNRARTMLEPRPKANGWCWPRIRPRSSCGRRSCSARRMISSTASPRSRGSRRRCRCPAAASRRMQPVFAGDVGEAIAKAVDGDLRSGVDLRAWRPGRAHVQGIDGVRRSPPRSAAVCWCRCRSR